MGDANIPACPQSNQLRGQNHDYHVTAMALKSFVAGLLTCHSTGPAKAKVCYSLFSMLAEVHSTRFTTRKLFSYLELVTRRSFTE